MGEKSSRLFENDFLEWLTHVNHKTPHVIYPPVIAACLYYAARGTSFSWPAIAVFFVLGFLEWTFFEYLMHRFLFHYNPNTQFGKRMAYLFHGIHHDFPGEVDRLVMPTVTSIVLSTILCLVHYLCFGPAGLILFAGFLFGYLYYEFVHYSVHNSKIKIGWSDWQRKNHLKHHFQDPENRFGVSTPLWDYVFGTYR